MGELAVAIETLATQALAILVMDIEYSGKLRPVYGHVPIRHMMLWNMCKRVLGDKFDETVSRLCAMPRGDGPVKTNPWLTRRDDTDSHLASSPPIR